MLFFKQTILALAILILGGLIFANVSKVHAATFEEQVVSLINNERQKQGIPAFSSSEKLYQASLDHNNKMFDCSKTYSFNSCFKHQVTLLNESTLMSRIKDMGYNPQSVAENIAWGYTTPASVVSGWMGSSGHRANILGSYKDIGCDYFDGLSGSYKGMYWTCDFGKSFGATSTTPTPTRALTPTPTRTPSLTPTRAPSITPTPTLRSISNTPTPTRIVTPTPIVRPSITPAVTPTVIPGSTAWWCMVAPSSMFCKP